MNKQNCKKCIIDLLNRESRPWASLISSNENLSNIVENVQTNERKNPFLKLMNSKGIWMR